MRVINERVVVVSGNLGSKERRDLAVRRVRGLIEDGLASGQGREDFDEDLRELLAIARGETD